MSALVVDTSSWSLYFRGRGSAKLEPALASGQVFLPVVVAGELLSAKLTDSRRSDLEALLEALPLAGEGLPHWFRVGRLRAALAAKGLAVSTPDAHVAQCAIELEAELLSDDHVFTLIARHTPLRTCTSVAP